VINQLNIIIKTNIKLYDETGELEFKIQVNCKEITKEKKGVEIYNINGLQII